ncbi:hypothetical protein D3C84_575850 [compost metagenome]
MGAERADRADQPERQEQGGHRGLRLGRGDLPGQIVGLPDGGGSHRPDLQQGAGADPAEDLRRGAGAECRAGQGRQARDPLGLQQHLLHLAAAGGQRRLCLRRSGWRLRRQPDRGQQRRGQAGSGRTQGADRCRGDAQGRGLQCGRGGLQQGRVGDVHQRALGLVEYPEERHRLRRGAYPCGGRGGQPAVHRGDGRDPECRQPQSGTGRGVPRELPAAGRGPEDGQRRRGARRGAEQGLYGRAGQRSADQGHLRQRRHGPADAQRPGDGRLLVGHGAGPDQHHLRSPDRGRRTG